MRNLTLIVAVAGAYALLRGWEGSPSLLLRSCLAIGTLVAGLAFWGIRKDSSQPRMYSLRRATWLDYLSLGAVIVFTEACFVVLTSTLAAPTQEMVVHVRDTISDPKKSGQNGSGSDNGNGPDNPGDIQFDGQRSGDWQFNRQLERTIPKSSNHKPSEKPEVFVELSNQTDAMTLFKSRIHLRSFALSQFNGISWSAIKIQKNKILDPVTFQPPVKLKNSTSIKHQIYHAINPTGQNLFTSLQGCRRTDLTELTQLAESIYLLPEPRTPDNGYEYSATSHSVHFTDIIGEPLTGAAGQPEELDLPPELADQLKQTAEAFIYQPTLAEQLISLRNFLQDNYTYSLKTTNASGANPLENFLYREKRGYCEHFATAAAMLCRTLNVPSRVAYGWSGGRFYKSQNMFVFRAKDAHAWTEIKLEGYGWVVFDTTPPDNEATPEAHAAPEGEVAPDPKKIITEQQQARQTKEPTLIKLSIRPWVLYTGLGAIGICSLGFLITRMIRRPLTTADGSPLSSHPPTYLIQFKQTCAALGYPMPTGRTLRQHIDVLLTNKTAPDFHKELLEYHYGILYSDDQKDPSVEKHLQKSIKSWAITADSEIPQNT